MLDFVWERGKGYRPRAPPLPSAPRLRSTDSPTLRPSLSDLPLTASWPGPGTRTPALGTVTCNTTTATLIPLTLTLAPSLTPTNRTPTPYAPTPSLPTASNTTAWTLSLAAATLSAPDAPTATAAAAPTRSLPTQSNSTIPTLSPTAPHALSLSAPATTTASRALTDTVAPVTPTPAASATASPLDVTPSVPVARTASGAATASPSLTLTDPRFCALAATIGGPAHPHPDWPVWLRGGHAPVPPGCTAPDAVGFVWRCVRTGAGQARGPGQDCGLAFDAAAPALRLDAGALAEGLAYHFSLSASAAGWGPGDAAHFTVTPRLPDPVAVLGPVGQLVDVRGPPLTLNASGSYDPAAPAGAARAFRWEACRLSRLDACTPGPVPGPFAYLGNATASAVAVGVSDGLVNQKWRFKVVFAAERARAPRSGSARPGVRHQAGVPGRGRGVEPARPHAPGAGGRPRDARRAPGVQRRHARALVQRHAGRRARVGLGPHGPPLPRAAPRGTLRGRAARPHAHRHGRRCWGPPDGGRRADRAGAAPAAAPPGPRPGAAPGLPQLPAPGRHRRGTAPREPRPHRALRRRVREPRGAVPPALPRGRGARRRRVPHRQRDRRGGDMARAPVPRPRGRGGAAVRGGLWVEDAAGAARRFADPQHVWPLAPAPGNASAMAREAADLLRSAAPLADAARAAALLEAAAEAPEADARAAIPSLAQTAMERLLLLPGGSFGDVQQRRVVARTIPLLMGARLRAASAAPDAVDSAADLFADAAAQALVGVARAGPAPGSDPLATDLVGALSLLLQSAVARAPTLKSLYQAVPHVYGALSGSLAAAQTVVVGAPPRHCDAAAGACVFRLGLARDEPYHLLRAAHATPLGARVSWGLRPDAALVRLLEASAAEAEGQSVDLHMAAWGLHAALRPARPALVPPPGAATQSVALVAVRGFVSDRPVVVANLSAPSRLRLPFPPAPGPPAPPPRCGYWDPGLGQWSTAGVDTVAGANATLCLSAHLTDFALLVPAPAPGPSPGAAPGAGTVAAVLGLVLGLVAALLLGLALCWRRQRRAADGAAAGPAPPGKAALRLTPHPPLQDPVGAAPDYGVAAAKRLDSGGGLAPAAGLDLTPGAPAPRPSPRQTTARAPAVPGSPLLPWPPRPMSGAPRVKPKAWLPPPRPRDPAAGAPAIANPGARAPGRGAAAPALSDSSDDDDDDDDDDDAVPTLRLDDGPAAPDPHVPPPRDAPVAPPPPPPRPLSGAGPRNGAHWGTVPRAQRSALAWAHTATPPPPAGPLPPHEAVLPQDDARPSAARPPPVRGLASLVADSPRGLPFGTGTTRARQALYRVNVGAASPSRGAGAGTTSRPLSRATAPSVGSGAGRAIGDGLASPPAPPPQPLSASLPGPVLHRTAPSAPPVDGPAPAPVARTPPPPPLSSPFPRPSAPPSAPS